VEVGAGHRSRPHQLLRCVEDRVDERRADRGDELAFRERPQLDRLDPPHQRIGRVRGGQHPRRPGEQEAARTAVTVVLGLDRPKETRLQLGLVDHQRVDPTIEERARVAAATERAVGSSRVRIWWEPR
jgi:hypothetical protein